MTVAVPPPVESSSATGRPALAFQRSYWDELSTTPGLGAVIDPADATGDKNARIDRRHRAAFRRFLRGAGVGRAGRVGRVLDFGCGIGRHHGLLSGVAEHYVGVDIAPGCSRAPGETHLIDGMHLPFEDGVFDLVVAFWVLQHVVDDATLAAIAAEFRRCLAPRGVVIVCERSLATASEPGRPAAYLRGRSPSEYARLFASRGLRMRRRRRLLYRRRWRAWLRPWSGNGEHFYAFAG